MKEHASSGTTNPTEKTASYIENYNLLHTNSSGVSDATYPTTCNLRAIYSPRIMSDILATPGLRFFAYRIKPDAPFTAVVTNFAAVAIVSR